MRSSVRLSVKRRIVSLLIVCAPAAPAALGAQLPTTVSAVVGVVEHETTLYGLSTRTEGPVFGGEVVVSPFHFTDIGLQVTAGTLSAATSGTSDQTPGLSSRRCPPRKTSPHGSQ